MVEESYQVSAVLNAAYTPKNLEALEADLQQDLLRLIFRAWRQEKAIVILPFMRSEIVQGFERIVQYATQVYNVNTDEGLVISS